MGNFHLPVVMLNRIFSELDEAGINKEKLLSKAGFQVEEISDPLSSFPYESYKKIFFQALKALNIPHLGLHIGSGVLPNHQSIAPYTIINQKTLRISQEVAEKILNKGHNYRKISFSETPKHFTLDLTPLTEEKELLAHLSEYVFIQRKLFWKFLSQGEIKPTEVHFTHKPFAPQEVYSDAFEAPVFFEAPQTFLRFPAHYLEKQWLGANLELGKTLVQVAQENTPELAQNEFIQKVLEAIAKAMNQGDVDLKEVAQIMGLPPRSLQTRLSEEGTTFHTMVNNFRQKASLEALKTDETIENISTVLGYKEPSAFHRAFKRWTGETPVQYRNRSKT